MLFKYFIKLGLNTLIDLLAKSISNSSTAKPIIDTLLFVIKRLLDILTDDDKDNTIQVEILLVNEFPEHLRALGYSYNKLKEEINIQSSDEESLN
jgi:hypothetical protein